MGKIEREIKVLDIDIKKTRIKLDEIGAEYKGIKKQKIYTYDIMSIYYRYMEAMELFKSDNNLLKENSIKKLKLVLVEFLDLLDNEKQNKIFAELSIKGIGELFKYENTKIIDKLNNSKTINKEIKKYNINHNKWVRLRQSNDKVELTVKHVLNKPIENFQNVCEYEIIVDDLEETNSILEQLGLFSRNYQEKNRISYKYKDAEIELDEWPIIKPYMEIETDNTETINEIVKILDLTDHEIVSLNTESLYKRIGVDVLSIPRLEFKKDNEGDK